MARLTLSALREALGGYEPRARKENDFAAMHKVQTTDPLDAPQSKTAATVSGAAEKTKDGSHPGERDIIDQGASKVDFHFPMLDQISPLPQDRAREGDLKAFGAISRVKGVEEGTNTYFARRKHEKEAELRTPFKPQRKVKTNSYFTKRAAQKKQEGEITEGVESNHFAVITDYGGKDDVHFFASDMQAGSFADREMREPGAHKVYLCKVLSVK